MAVDLYGATEIELLAAVNALLVWNVEDSSHPTAAEVAKWFPLAASRVRSKVGDLEGSCDPEGFTARARHLIAVWVAALADDAHYPERTDDKNRYAQVLRAQFTDDLAGLATDVEDCRDGQAGGVRGEAAHSFPDPPFFTRTMGF